MCACACACACMHACACVCMCVCACALTSKGVCKNSAIEKKTYLQSCTDLILYVRVRVRHKA